MTKAGPIYKVSFRIRLNNFLDLRKLGLSEEGTRGEGFVCEGMCGIDIAIVARYMGMGKPIVGTVRDGVGIEGRVHVDITIPTEPPNWASSEVWGREEIVELASDRSKIRGRELEVIAWEFAKAKENGSL